MQMMSNHAPLLGGAAGGWPQLSQMPVTVGDRDLNSRLTGAYVWTVTVEAIGLVSPIPNAQTLRENRTHAYIYTALVRDVNRWITYTSHAHKFILKDIGKVVY